MAAGRQALNKEQRMYIHAADNVVQVVSSQCCVVLSQ